MKTLSCILLLYLLWIPRVLTVLFVIFISLFALDAFGQRTGFLKTLLAFMIHMIPAFLIITILVFSWKWPLIGGIGFTLLGLVYLYWAGRNNQVYALIYTPLFLTGVLFLISWLLRDRIREAKDAYNE
jgi:hypothetical protein